MPRRNTGFITWLVQKLRGFRLFVRLYPLDGTHQAFLEQKWIRWSKKPYDLQTLLVTLQELALYSQP